jgi:hypothetical protein
MSQISPTISSGHASIPAQGAPYYFVPTATISTTANGVTTTATRITGRPVCTQGAATSNMTLIAATTWPEVVTALEALGLTTIPNEPTLATPPASS